MAHPADDYVAACTKDAPKAKVLTAQMLMQTLPVGATVQGEVPASALAATLAGQMLDTNALFAVVFINSSHSSILQSRNGFHCRKHLGFLLKNAG